MYTIEKDLLFTKVSRPLDTMYPNNMFDIVTAMRYIYSNLIYDVQQELIDPPDNYFNNDKIVIELQWKSTENNPGVFSFIEANVFKEMETIE